MYPNYNLLLIFNRYLIFLGLSETRTIGTKITICKRGKSEIL